MENSPYFIINAVPYRLSVEFHFETFIISLKIDNENWNFDIQIIEKLEFKVQKYKLMFTYEKYNLETLILHKEYEIWNPENKN